MFDFKIHKIQKGSKARLGELKTPHGVIKTPNFNPVGTQATVKGLSALDIKEIGAQIILSNAYHLHLRPGEDEVAKRGGLGKFMAWDGPTMTDSGGFQVFSLGAAYKTKGKLNKFSSNVFVYDDETPKQEKRTSLNIKPAKIDEEGVTFFSHLDGDKKRLDPQISMDIQEKLGADLIVAFDDHESPVWEYAETKHSLERSNRWGLESLKVHKRSADQLMYGVVHGGVFEDLRKESAIFTDKHFPAIAIGGAYTSKEVLYNVLEWTLPLTDPQKPRHLLGIGEFVDLFEGVHRGVDFFDCVAPTRRGRHGNVYIAPSSGGTVKNKFCLTISNAAYKDDPLPIDPTCDCKVCKNFTRSYIHHLFRAQELLGFHLASYHNIYFITKTMEKVREAIAEDRFLAMKKEWIDLHH
ncbi:tRNA guanosine(34) transglycosylase Tgt [Candidatus Woesebacteria bacterium]|nr:tRNA guanosine(34) transglycosylase Tgt [Candidatus Woesebacteria bacterium]